MAYALKYECEFTSLNGVEFNVRINELDYVGSSRTLLTANDINPLEVKWNEQDDDFTVPIMSLNGTLHLAIRHGTADPIIEDFISLDERKHQIEVIYNTGAGSQTWFTAWLLPNTSTEGYYSVNRVLSLNFSDGLAKLKDIPLVTHTGAKFDRVVKQRLFDLIKGALWSAQPNTTIETFDNLFYVGAADRTVTSTNDPLNQTKIDPRTFMKSQADFEDAYTVLSKILSARGLNVFMDGGNWIVANYITYVGFIDPINGTKYDPDGTTITAISSRTWHGVVGDGEDLVPVENHVSKSYGTPMLKNRINFEYDDFPFLVCNESLTEGTASAVTCWTYQRGAYASPSAGLYDHGLSIELNTANIVVNRSAYIDADFAQESWLKSESFRVEINSVIRIDFQRSVYENPSPSTAGVDKLVGVYLTADDGTYYTMDDDGLWYQSNSSWSVNNKSLAWIYDSADNRQDFVFYSLEFQKTPKTGSITLRLFSGVQYGSADQKTFFKDLKLGYTNLLGRIADPIFGDYDEIDCTSNLSFKGEKNYDVFLSDSPLINVKGAYFKTDGVTLTEAWYYNGIPGMIGELSTQRPMKYWIAIMHYWLTKKFRQKLIVTLRGNRYEFAGKMLMLNPVVIYQVVNGAANSRYMATSLGINVYRGVAQVSLYEINEMGDTEDFPNHAGVHTHDFITRKTGNDSTRLVLRWWQ
jgi:hypothetical protein